MLAAGFNVLAVDADGHCFFNAMAHGEPQRAGVTVTALDVRAAAAAELCSARRPYYENLFALEYYDAAPSSIPDFDNIYILYVSDVRVGVLSLETMLWEMPWVGQQGRTVHFSDSASVAAAQVALKCVANIYTLAQDEFHTTVSLLPQLLPVDTSSFRVASLIHITSHFDLLQQRPLAPLPSFPLCISTHDLQCALDARCLAVSAPPPLRPHPCPHALFSLSPPLPPLPSPPLPLPPPNSTHVSTPQAWAFKQQQQQQLREF